MALVILPLLFGLIIMTVSILASVFLGLCVYNDALSNSRTDGVMWGLLCGFLGFIPAIIYLVIRKNNSAMTPCPGCGYPSVSQMCNCPNCGAQKPLWPPVNAYTEEKKKKSKNFLITTIVMWAASIVIGIVFGVVFAVSLLNSIGPNEFIDYPYSYSYSHSDNYQDW